MSRPNDAPAHQAAVDSLFDAEVGLWHDLYHSSTLRGHVYQERQRAALAWVDSLALPVPQRALDVGCGAGELSVALADRGFKVDAIDGSDEMLSRVRNRGHANVRPSRGDVNTLAYDSGTFDLVVALGVLPWISSPRVAIGEIQRVLRPGGYAILTSDNRYRLTFLIDPRMNPPGRALKEAARRVVGLPRYTGPHRYDAPRMIERLVREIGFHIESTRTIGFGPFTFLGANVLPERAGIRIHHALQSLADRRIPPISHLGAHHILLAKRH